MNADAAVYLVELRFTRDGPDAKFRPTHCLHMSEDSAAEAAAELAKLDGYETRVAEYTLGSIIWSSTDAEETEGA